MVIAVLPVMYHCVHLKVVHNIHIGEDSRRSKRSRFECIRNGEIPLERPLKKCDQGGRQRSRRG